MDLVAYRIVWNGPNQATIIVVTHQRQICTNRIICLTPLSNITFAPIATEGNPIACTDLKPAQSAWVGWKDIKSGKQWNINDNCFLRGTVHVNIWRVVEGSVWVFENLVRSIRKSTFGSKKQGNWKSILNGHQRDLTRMNSKQTPQSFALGLNCHPLGLSCPAEVCNHPLSTGDPLGFDATRW